MMSHRPLQQQPLKIRQDLVEGHDHAWAQIAQPGTWWTGAERISIAKAARQAWHCALCDERKAALAPSAGDADAKHDSSGTDTLLPDAVIDIVHRLVRDQARLSREWLDTQVADQVLTMVQYVELVGVVTQVVSLDTFRLAVGLALDPIPEPQPGDATRYEPPGLAMEDAWVPMILTENLGPEEKDLYGITGNVVRAMSAVPEAVRALKELSSHHYLAMEQMLDFVGGESVGRSIDRAQTELIAGRVSALHECFY